MTAYFFRDPGGQLPVTATLYHEVSHQLLFETAGHNGYTRNVGNYWVFEGLGTYFETVSPQPDGSLEVGGLVGRRIEEGIRTLVGNGQLVPMAEFIALDQNAFNRKPDIYHHYQQAMALTVFLCSGTTVPTATRSSTTFATPTAAGSSMGPAGRFKAG